MIIGTGTNASYVEKASRVTKWQPPLCTVTPNMDTIINVEWGAFNSESLPRCDEDWEVDQATVHKGENCISIPVVETLDEWNAPCCMGVLQANTCSRS